MTHGGAANISSKNRNAATLPEYNDNGLLETLRLTSIPGMAERLHKAATEPLDQCKKYDPNLEW